MNQIPQNILNQVRSNPLISICLFFIGVFELAGEFAGSLKSPVFQDGAYAAVFLVVLVELVRIQYKLFSDHYAYSKKKYTSRGHFWRSLKMMRFNEYFPIMAAGFSLAFLIPILPALARHLVVSNAPSDFCVRLAPECRQCAQFLDIRKRPTSDMCVPHDAGGLVEFERKKLAYYQPAYIDVTCGNEKKTIVKVHPKSGQKPCINIES